MSAGHNTHDEELILIYIITEHNYATLYVVKKLANICTKYCTHKNITHQLIQWGHVAYDVSILGTILISHFHMKFCWIQSSTEENSQSEKK
jgi:hypothetical protein